MLQSPCTSSEPGDILAGSLLPFVWNFSWLFITSLGHFVPREKSTKYHIFESLRRKIHVSEQETSVPDLTRSNSKLENQKESKSTSDPKSDQLPFLACFSCIWDSTANPGFPRFIPPIYVWQLSCLWQKKTIEKLQLSASLGNSGQGKTICE